jgi:hypothetical protein
VLVTARAARAMLGAALDACSAGEQTLIARLVAGHPEISAAVSSSSTATSWAMS